MNVDKLDKKKLSIVLWSKDSKGDDDVVVFFGILEVVSGKVNWIRDDTKEKLLIVEDWIEKIEKVQDECKEALLNADYAIHLTCGHLPENVDMGNYIKTCLKWP